MQKKDGSVQMHQKGPYRTTTVPVRYLLLVLAFRTSERKEYVQPKKSHCYIIPENQLFLHYSQRFCQSGPMALDTVDLFVNVLDVARSKMCSIKLTV